MTFRIMMVVSAATQQSMVFSWAVAERRNDTKYFVLFRTHCFGVYLGISLCTGFCFWQHIFVSLRISYGEEDLWLAGTGEHTGISSICHSESHQRASFGKGVFNLVYHVWGDVGLVHTHWMGTMDVRLVLVHICDIRQSKHCLFFMFCCPMDRFVLVRLLLYVHCLVHNSDVTRGRTPWRNATATTLGSFLLHIVATIIHTCSLLTCLDLS
ncbi:hypothetical protein BDV97DRAFT_198137 [Delphinella strobiligena]|nr:hypothetical protein BDV97DRAFT_198137 [Delphinella strobiligena]